MRSGGWRSASPSRPPLPPTLIDPVVTCDDIRRRGAAMSAVCTPVVTRPKPPPPPPPAPAPTPAKEKEPKADGAPDSAAKPAADADAANGEAASTTPGADAPMETESPKVNVEEVADDAAAAPGCCSSSGGCSMNVEEPSA